MLPVFRGDATHVAQVMDERWQVYAVRLVFPENHKSAPPFLWQYSAMSVTIDWNDCVWQ